MEFIYLYDEVPKDLSENGYSLIDWTDPPEITRIINQQYSFYGSYSMKGQNRKLIKKGRWIKALWEDGSWQYFKIKTVYKTLTSVSFNATHLGYDANRNFIQMAYTSRGNGKQIMANLKAKLAFNQLFNYESDIITQHQFTAKEVNPIASIIGENGGNQNLVGVTGGELDMDNYNLTLRERIGQDNGYRIDLGVNLESVKETVDDMSVVNSLHLVGGVPEDTDYNKEQEPVTFKYLEVKGVTDANRQIAKRENSECLTVAELKKWGQTLFDNDRIHEPKVMHEINMIPLENTIEYKDLYEQIASLHFGDTVHCDIEQTDISVQERMFGGVYYPTLKKWKTITLGNDMGMYTSSVDTAVSEVTKKLESRSRELQGAIVNATQWITGTKGGYVRFRPKDAPSEILIMDRDKASEAKKVWRWNLGGLGFSNKGVDGPYETAITQDGSIVANFIKVGKIQADVFQSSFNQSTGDVLKLVGGVLQIENDKRKIMELTKKGLEFWNGKEHIGTMGTKGNPFPNLSDNNGPVVTDGNSLLLVGDNKKKIVGLSNENNTGIALNGGDQFFLGNSFNFIGTNGGQGVIHCKKLVVNGKEITGGGSGSGGGGTPPGLTTDQERNAWAVWSYFKARGWTEEAVAGMLGNMQSESGILADIDELGGGGGYGLVQWTPKSKLVDWCNARGIDYRTIDSQCQRIQWEMENEQQWIATNSYPYSFKAFTTKKSISECAYAFITNYERPLNSNQPIRATQAQYWYDKLHGLTGGGDWMNPVHSSYVVTQEWDIIGAETTVIHGGIDLASMPPGTKPPIYAAKAGVVIISGSNPAFEGNYVMIDHLDGYYTYYGHFDSVNVKQGDEVTTSSIIGIMGATGIATGVHLHFEVRKGGQSANFRINPRDVIKF